MVRAFAFDEPQYMEKASLGGKASAHSRWEEPLNIPMIDRVGWDGFLRHLVAKHGADYLRRPDGVPLAMVDEAGRVRGYVA